ncbi:MAG: hypothetical protein ACI9ZT_001151 [Gammaproteobacteria bacterium]
MRLIPVIIMLLILMNSWLGGVTMISIHYSRFN